MAHPQAYAPEMGFRYQILTRSCSRVWEHCDYATNKRELNYLLSEYRMAYGPSFEFKTILLPAKYYWPPKANIGAFSVLGPG